MKYRGERVKSINEYVIVQAIAKDTMDYLLKSIEVGMTEIDIVILAENYMKQRGISEFWYYNIGAFVFVGKRTILSVSGREYAPTNMVVAQNDIITVDLSPPMLNGCWGGDYARTITVCDSRVLIEGVGLDSNVKKEYYDGINIEKLLHEYFVQHINEDMTFEDVYHVINKKIKDYGYKNLDFMSNLGHTIEVKKKIVGCILK